MFKDYVFCDQVGPTKSVLDLIFFVCKPKLHCTLLSWGSILSRLLCKYSHSLGESAAEQFAQQLTLVSQK
jgi:hypothetical protein